MINREKGREFDLTISLGGDVEVDAVVHAREPVGAGLSGVDVELIDYQAFSLSEDHGERVAPINLTREQEREVEKRAKRTGRHYYEEWLSGWGRP